METEEKKSLTIISEGAIIIFLGMILGTLIGIINQIIFARTLGPDSYGIFNLAIAFISIIAAFCTFGLIGSLPRFIPFYLEKDENDSVASVIKFSLKFVFLTSFLAGIFLLFFSDNIALFFNKAELSLVLKIFGLTLPILILPTILESIIRGFKKSKYKIYIFEISLRIFTLLIFVPFIFTGKVFIGFMAAYIGSYLFVLLLSFVTIDKKIIPFLSKKYKKINIKKELLLFSWPLALSSLSYLFISKTDTLILGYFASSESVGIYTIALTVSSVLYFIWYALTWIFLPVISESFSKTQKKLTESLFKTTSKWSFLIIMPVLIIIIILSNDIIILFFGTEYSLATLPLIILSIGLSMNMLTGLTGNMLVGNGQTRLNLFSEIIGGITNLSLNIYLIPLYGITGAALGTALSYLTRNMASTYFVYKTINIHPFKYEYIKIVTISILLFFSLLLIKNKVLIQFGSILNIIMVLIIVLATYPFLIYIFNCLDENDYFIIKQVAKNLKIMIKKR